jgi:hypothetical protein
MTPSEICPARCLGFCQLIDPKRCYARKAEKQYRQVLPFRYNQHSFWIKCTADDFVSRFIREKNRRTIRFLRFNESGDFISQDCVDKTIEIAKILKKGYGIGCYLYTSRKDLDFSGRESLVITGSNFMVDNNFVVVYNKDDLRLPYCISDCRLCQMCMEKKKRTIVTLLH